MCTKFGGLPGFDFMLIKCDHCLRKPLFTQTTNYPLMLAVNVMVVPVSVNCLYIYKVLNASVYM